MNEHFSEKSEKLRVETFIDAILAIIVTILVLEFKVPEEAYSSDAEIGSFLRHLAPSFLSYLISFTIIITLWIEHHCLFHISEKADTRFVLLNFLFILFLSRFLLRPHWQEEIMRVRLLLH